VDFLVEIAVSLPPDMDADRRSALLAAELERGRELRRSGTLQRIWRVPGALRNVGIWRAADATELHEAIASLPAFPWLRATVTPLAQHPVEAPDPYGAPPLDLPSARATD
jgi:muconolactone D-isomerase